MKNIVLMYEKSLHSYVRIFSMIFTTSELIYHNLANCVKMVTFFFTVSQEWFVTFKTQRVKYEQSPRTVDTSHLLFEADYEYIYILQRYMKFCSILVEKNWKPNFLKVNIMNFHIYSMLSNRPLLLAIYICISLMINNTDNFFRSFHNCTF